MLVCEQDGTLIRSTVYREEIQRINIYTLQISNQRCLALFSSILEAVGFLSQRLLCGSLKYSGLQTAEFLKLHESECLELFYILRMQSSQMVLSSRNLWDNNAFPSPKEKKISHSLCYRQTSIFIYDDGWVLQMSPFSIAKLAAGTLQGAINGTLSPDQEGSVRWSLHK